MQINMKTDLILDRLYQMRRFFQFHERFDIDRY